MNNWTKDAIFYHMYPLGLLGCERYAIPQTMHRIISLIDWIPHLKRMHINAIYLGPIFASYEHGYDTSDYRMIDSRLGTNEDFKKVCTAYKKAKIHIVLDGVFNHVGRDFWAFQDVITHGEQSQYKDWFHINFHEQSPLQDPFTYEAWEGHFNLVKLNLNNEQVIDYLLQSIGMWMNEFQIDGLRLDTADCIEPSFFHKLNQFCKHKNPDFWLMGEIIHGDYNRWANNEMLDSITNYECYKGLFSSHNEKNYFEIAHSLHRQFGNGGVYQQLHLYNFVDNHDVNRIASVMKRDVDLKNIYTMMYAMPGIPSIYYGSEYAIKGIKHDGSDADIRPCLKIDEQPHELKNHICKLGKIYNNYEALRYGTYKQIIVQNEQFVFQRTNENQVIYAVFNIGEEMKRLSFSVSGQIYHDVLQDTYQKANNSDLEIEVAPHSSMLLVEEKEITVKETESMKEIHTDIKIGRYRHFKGKEYAVLYTATHSETLETYVVYRQLYDDGDVWIRPITMFLETIERDGKKQQRFTYIGK